MDWIKDTKHVQRATVQDSHVLMEFMATSNTITKDSMSGVSTHLMTNIKECYEKVLAQPQAITELLLQGQDVD